MSNVLSYLTCFGWLPLFLMSLLGLGLGWLLFRGRGHAGDLTSDGEGTLRAELDGERARVRELEGRLSSSDGEVSSLKTKLAAAGAATAAAAGAASLAGGKAEAASSDGDDDSYALEWRNRYLAARVKYLEGRLAEAPKAKPARKRRRPRRRRQPRKRSSLRRRRQPRRRHLLKERLSQRFFILMALPMVSQMI